MAEPALNEPKDPLDHDTLRDVIDLSLWAGQMLLQYGAASHRIEETVHRFATGLGCDWADILVSPNVIIITTSSGQEFRTKVRRIVRIGVNMTVLSELNQLTRQIGEGGMDRFQVRAALERISTMQPGYNRWEVIAMVGVACAAFSQLFGGDAPIFFVTLGAASAAMFVRQELMKRYFNPLLVVIGTAFAAGLLASGAAIFELGQEPELALVASVLLLVPGVPLINASEDLIEGHIVMGIARGITAWLIVLGIAIGLVLAMRLTGVSNL